NPDSFSLFLLLGWHEYNIGISYFSAILLIALNSDKKFVSVSIFSSRWALNQIYPFTFRFSFSKIFDDLIWSRLLCNTSAIGEPVTYTLSFSSPHSCKYFLACSLYARLTSEMISTIWKNMPKENKGHIHKSY